MNIAVKDTVLKSYGHDGQLIISTLRDAKAEQHVDSLKRWFFKVFEKNDVKVSSYVSKLLRNSFDNFLLSWKRITTSTGAKTAGVDKKKWKNKNFSHFIQAYRLSREFQDIFKTNYKVRPLRRKNIPKPDGSMRPLGSPTISDRLLQARDTPAIETIVEYLVNKYELNTFGFRKSCRAQDAVNCLGAYAHQGKNARVIDMDIAKCFDKINHGYILDQIQKFGLDEQYFFWIDEMLHSGFIDLGNLYETNEGTPQGGVISPALCNLVVRPVLDIPVKEAKCTGIQNINIVSYADDAVITISPNGKCKEETVNLGMKQLNTVITSNLAKAGLELKKEKTRIIYDETPFDFLGFEISRGRGIRPSKKKLKAHHEKVATLLKKGSKIENVNSTIRGFYNYYAHFSSGKMWESLGKLDWFNGRWLWKKGLDTSKIVTVTDIPKCTKYMSPQKGATPLLPEYQKFFNERKWTGRKKYFAQKQKGICPFCTNKLGNDPTHLEIHHSLQKSKGGKDKNSNVVLRHESCHHLIHQFGESL